MGQALGDTNGEVSDAAAVSKTANELLHGHGDLKQR
jgi:hypothetical protein